MVIGALRYLGVEGYGESSVTVTVQFEANYTEVAAGHDGGDPQTPGRERTYYVVEDWTLTRRPGAHSRPPEKASVIGCPNCGAPLSELRGNRCMYCQQIVDTGAFDWMVTAIEGQDRMERPPQLTSDTEETGTDLPTVVDPDARLPPPRPHRQGPGLPVAPPPRPRGASSTPSSSPPGPPWSGPAPARTSPTSSSRCSPTGSRATSAPTSAT